MNVALELQPCCGNRSGIGTYTYELARRLRDGDGITYSGTIFNCFGREHSEQALDGIQLAVEQCQLFPYGIYRRIWHWVPIKYQQLFSPADIRIFFDFIVPPRVDGKVMTTVHDLSFLRYPETIRRVNRQRIERDIQYSLDRSDKIITISEFSKKELMELMGVEAERIALVSPAPACIETDCGTADLSRFSIQSPYLLYVGTIEPRKNLVFLIKAFEYLKKETGCPHQLVLAGGKGWNNEEIYLAAQESPYQKEIVFTGYISQAEKTALYQGASLFVFPSLYEGFGIPPLEAMGAGCPVVCSDAASLPEVVGDAAKLISPTDMKGLAQAMAEVLFDPAQRADLIARGRERTAVYTWEKSAKRLHELCKRLA